MTDKGTAQWTLRKTPEREALMKELRELLEETRPDSGERIHGVLTDAQIFVWGMLELRNALKQTQQSDEPVTLRTGNHRRRE